MKPNIFQQYIAHYVYRIFFEYKIKTYAEVSNVETESRAVCLRGGAEFHLSSNFYTVYVSTLLLSPRTWVVRGHEFWEQTSLEYIAV